MDNLYDFYTGATPRKISRWNINSNGTANNKYGVYLGNISKENATDIKSMQDHLGFLQNQINFLSDQFDQLNKQHQRKLIDCLGFFGNCSKVARLDMETDDILVDDDCHIWVVYAD